MNAHEKEEWRALGRESIVILQGLWWVLFLRVIVFGAVMVAGFYVGAWATKQVTPDLSWIISIGFTVGFILAVIAWVLYLPTLKRLRPEMFTR